MLWRVPPANGRDRSGNVTTPGEMQPDHTTPLRNTLVVGQGSSGKTTLAIRYLLNVPWTCAFIFDLQGQFARRLGKRWVGTAKECDEALATGFVCLNPYRMFDADKTDEAVNGFAGWADGRYGSAAGRG